MLWAGEATTTQILASPSHLYYIHIGRICIISSCSEHNICSGSFHLGHLGIDHAQTWFIEHNEPIPGGREGGDPPYRQWMRAGRRMSITHSLPYVQHCGISVWVASCSQVTDFLIRGDEGLRIKFLRDMQGQAQRRQFMHKG